MSPVSKEGRDELSFELEGSDSTRLSPSLFSFMEKINPKVALFDELLHTHGE